MKFKLKFNAMKLMILIENEFKFKLHLVNDINDMNDIKFLTRNANANANKPLENELANDNDKNVFINHSVKILARNDFVKTSFGKPGGGGAP